MTASFRSISFSAWLVAGVILVTTIVATWIGFGSGSSRDASPAAAEQSTLAWSKLKTGEAAAVERLGGKAEKSTRVETHTDAAASAQTAAPAASPRGASISPPAAPVSSPSPAPIVFSAYPRDLVIVAPEGNVPLPVAFQPLSQDVGMPPDQRARLDAIQEQFLTAIGGPSQDPASSVYQELWRKAQREADAQFKAAFGPTAFMRRFMAGLREQRSASATP